MDIRNFILRKRSGTDLSDEPDISSGKEVSGRTESVTSYAAANELPPKKQHQSASEKRKVYKSKLSYEKEWESMYPWVTCELPNDGMFCSTCQKWRSPPAFVGGGNPRPPLCITPWKVSQSFDCTIITRPGQLPSPKFDYYSIPEYAEPGIRELLT